MRGGYNFFREKGFLIQDRCYVDKLDDSEIESYLRELEGKTVVVILEKDSYLKKYENLLKQYKIRFQLFSRVEWFFLVFRPNLKIVFDYLEDDYSKEVFSVSLAVHFKFLPESAIWSYYDPLQYFSLPEMYVYDAEEVFIDCGAYCGDTIEDYVRSRGNYFKKAYAFEPGRKQYEAMTHRVKRICMEAALDERQIECVPYGVGKEYAKLNEAEGKWYPEMVGARRLVKSSEEGTVQVVDLDTYLKDESHISFIKADIEGAEMDMLHGAKNIIQRDKPKLAITLYHNLTDYYEIPLYVKSLVPDYKFKIRHHSLKFPETVLYAYI